MTQHHKLTDETGTRSLDPKHAPVSLPPGSVDFDKLMTGLNHVVKAKEEDRDNQVRLAIEHASNTANILGDRDGATQEGFVTKAVEHETIDGLVENRSVFVAAEAEKAAKAHDDASTSNVATSDSTK